MVIYYLDVPHVKTLAYYLAEVLFKKVPMPVFRFDEQGEGRLDSALKQPAQHVFGLELHKSMAEKASTFMYGIIQNHPFIDGNKRLGLSTALVFLLINGYVIDTNDEEVLTDLCLSVANADDPNRMSKNDLVKWFENHIRPDKRGLGLRKIVKQ